jgi:hypothetical protein
VKIQPPPPPRLIVVDKWKVLDVQVVIISVGQSALKGIWWKEYTSSVSVTPGRIFWKSSQGLHIAMKGRIWAHIFEDRSPKVN